MKKIRYLLLIIVIMICIFFYQDPYAMEESKILMAPTFENILGCDNLGRDIFSRLLLGSFFHSIRVLIKKYTNHYNYD